ncbi:hypothetical protein QE152_g29677 [Popillia japonica]|uniref:Uncharacterized protein n=1 Tax=Popillia japonica TaxID=7064 RepID=A0AAW1JGK9_POPJA
MKEIAAERKQRKTKKTEIKYNMKDLKNAATERQLTKQKGNRKKEWLDEECKTEIEKRKRLRIRLLESQKEIDKIKFQEQRKKVKRLCRQRKRRAMERKLRAMEDKYKRKEIRNFYKDAKEIRKGHNGRTVHYKNKEGHLIYEENEVADRWREYFEELLNEPATEINSYSQSVKTNLQDEEEEPTRDEINNIINKLQTFRTIIKALVK